MTAEHPAEAPAQECRAGGDHESHYITEDDGRQHWRCLRCGQVMEPARAADVLHAEAVRNNPGHADWTNCPIDGPCAEDATALAPLLADRDAAARAEGRAEVEAAVLAIADKWEAEAGEDERWLAGPRVEVSEAHELPALIRQGRDHATAVRALTPDSSALADRGRAAAEKALREAASDIQVDCTNQPGPCICVARDWLRERADRLADDTRPDDGSTS